MGEGEEARVTNALVNDVEKTRSRTITYLELSVISHHPLETDTNALDDSKEDGAHDGGVPGSLDTTADGQGTTGEETGDDGVVSILLLTETLDGAVEGTEHATPNTEVSTEDRGASLDGRDGTYPALTVGAVAETLDTVPDSTTDSLNSSQDLLAIRNRC